MPDLICHVLKVHFSLGFRAFAKQGRKMQNFSFRSIVCLMSVSFTDLQPLKLKQRKCLVQSRQGLVLPLGQAVVSIYSATYSSKDSPKRHVYFNFANAMCMTVMSRKRIIYKVIVQIQILIE